VCSRRLYLCGTAPTCFRAPGPLSDAVECFSFPNHTSPRLISVAGLDHNSSDWPDIAETVGSALHDLG